MVQQTSDAIVSPRNVGCQASADRHASGSVAIFCCTNFFFNHEVEVGVQALDAIERFVTQYLSLGCRRGFQVVLQCSYKQLVLRSKSVVQRAPSNARCFTELLRRGVCKTMNTELAHRSVKYRFLVKHPWSAHTGDSSRVMDSAIHNGPRLNRLHFYRRNRITPLRCLQGWRDLGRL